MAVKFIWNDDYATGIVELDEQHKKILELGNKLSEEDGKNCLKKSIMDLYKYTRIHFEYEENLMRNAGYPDWEIHRKIHEELIDKLNTVGEKAAGESLSLDEFKRFVYIWIIDHVMYQDKKFTDFYKNQIKE